MKKKITADEIFNNPTGWMNPTIRKVRTYENTAFATWWKLAIDAFLVRGLPEPTFGEAHDAFEMGNTPETWADYVKGSERG